MRPAACLARSSAPASPFSPALGGLAPARETVTPAALAPSASALAIWSSESLATCCLVRRFCIFSEASTPASNVSPAPTVSTTATRSLGTVTLWFAV